MEYRATSIKETKNRFRFYRMHIEKSLFGEYMLIRTWGRIGQKGRTQITYGSLKKCMNEYDEILRIREKHNYTE